MHAVAGVDEDDGQLARRGAGGHVARVLLVAGRVGDDELAAVGREVAVRHVDGDALLALGLQAVGQQGEVDLAGAGGADLLAVALHRGELVLVDHLGVVQQPADERALAVVDAAAGEEAQQLLLLVAGEVGVDVFLTRGRRLASQKYPSRFFCSIDPVSSWSITRPCRSEFLASSISSMISGSVVALLSIAPVSG